MTRYKPFASAFQSRFKWRHKPTDKWRRLMDSTCFSIDWITRPSGPSMDQSSGFWTHILTPAHCATPWNYPNYYPPTGDTRFVSKITYADVRTQIRFVSQQGDAIHKFFLSNNHTFLHSNPRLDLAVIHPEQFLRRQGGEMKLVHIQNQGKIMRPMLDVAKPVQKGDAVWIYGLTAEEALFDEEKGEEPKMIPTAIRGIVHATTQEQFWVDTMGEEVHMGMCGAPVMRGGKCIGMLTAKVHALSETKELAGCAMCTYSKDIFEFLVEVEEQLKNGNERMDHTYTRFEREREVEEARRAAGINESVAGVHNQYRYGNDFDYANSKHQLSVRTRPQTFRDWDKDETRLARRIQVPISSFRDGNDVDWNTADGFQASQAYGPAGLMNDEVQENLGYHMNDDRDRHGKPSRLTTPPAEVATEFRFEGSPRRDPSPEVTVHGEDVAVENGRIVKKKAPKEKATEDLREMLLMSKQADGAQAESLGNLTNLIRNIKASNEAEELRNSAFATGEKVSDQKIKSGDYYRSDRYRGDAAKETETTEETKAAVDGNDDDAHSTFSSRTTAQNIGMAGVQYDAHNRDNIYVANQKIPKEFVEGVKRYAAVDKAMREHSRRGQQTVGDAEEHAREEYDRRRTHNVDGSDTSERFESASSSSSNNKARQDAGAEIERRMARKAQRAAERAKRDAEHEASLRARHARDRDPRLVDSDVEGLW